MSFEISFTLQGIEELPAKTNVATVICDVTRGKGTIGGVSSRRVGQEVNFAPDARGSKCLVKIQLPLFGRRSVPLPLRTLAGHAPHSAGKLTERYKELEAPSLGQTNQL